MPGPCSAAQCFPGASPLLPAALQTRVPSPRSTPCPTARGAQRYAVHASFSTADVTELLLSGWEPAGAGAMDADPGTAPLGTDGATLFLQCGVDRNGSCLCRALPKLLTVPYCLTKGGRNPRQRGKPHQAESGNGTSGGKHVPSPSKPRNKVISGITAIFYFSAPLSRSLTHRYTPTAVRPAQ